jgi:hypothetical protein
MQTSAITKPVNRAQPRRHFTKRIGNTNYEVSVHFSDTSRESLEDKIMRLIRNDALGKMVGE